MSMAVPSTTGRHPVKKRKERCKNSCRLHTCNITIKAMSQRQKRLTLIRQNNMIHRKKREGGSKKKEQKREMR